MFPKPVAKCAACCAQLCRKKYGKCDVADYCDGYSADCVDKVASNTTVCFCLSTQVALTDKHKQPVRSRRRGEHRELLQPAAFLATAASTTLLAASVVRHVSSQCYCQQLM